MQVAILIINIITIIISFITISILEDKLKKEHVKYFRLLLENARISFEYTKLKHGETINIKDIKITYWFRQKQPKEWKMKRKEQYYLKNNTFESTIYIDDKNRLIDGYTTYLLAKKYDKEYIKVKRK